MRITDNFTLEELIRSDRHPDIDNIPLPEERSNLIALTVHVLQPLRDIYGKPMHVNSGYRSPALNRAVGGVPTSQHVKGQAADIRCDEPMKLLQLMRENNIVFDQCGIYSNFCHISYRKNGNNRNMVFYGKY